MASTSELLDRWVELFNAGRFEDAEQDYAPGAIIEEVGPNRRFTPREATENARAWKQAFPDARGTIAGKIIDGNRGVAEIVWRGTNRGPLMGNPPTGRSATVRAVAVIETNGSKITRATHYIDMASLMGQLGIAAGAQPAA